MKIVDATFVEVHPKPTRKPMRVGNVLGICFVIALPIMGAINNFQAPPANSKPVATHIAAPTSEALIKLAVAFLDEDAANLKAHGLYRNNKWFISEERWGLAPSFVFILKEKHNITFPASANAWDILRQANMRRIGANP